MKYDPEGPFNDPVVRCCDCQALITREIIQKMGKCPKCSCRRMRAVSNMNQKEHDQLERLEIDPEYLELFEGYEMEGVIDG